MNSGILTRKTKSNIKLQSSIIFSTYNNNIFSIYSRVRCSINLIRPFTLKPFELNKFITLYRNSENTFMKKEFRRSKLKFNNISRSIYTEIKLKVSIEKLRKIYFDLIEKISNPKSDLLNETLMSLRIIENDIKDYNFEMSKIIDYIMLSGINKNIFKKRDDTH